MRSSLKATTPVAEQDREFLAAVRENREPAINAEAVRPAMRVLQAVQDAYESWRPAGAEHSLT